MQAQYSICSGCSGSSIKLGLQNITLLLKYLGNPHRRLNCVHVAGSNGKGSTCALLHAILQAAGYRAGLYTSPHLIDFTERIQIGGGAIPRGRVAELTADLKKICERKSLATMTFLSSLRRWPFSIFNRSRLTL
ncbi:MAG: hypothetical protein MZU95_03040 [Desulfomicrobium escambiense]|nr:hypothetical protein [Desulfomicrobium escambiense]